MITKPVLVVAVSIVAATQVLGVKKCSPAFSVLAENPLHCAITCASESGCHRYRFEDGTCYMEDTSLNGQFVKGQPWMSCVHRNLSNVATFRVLDNFDDYLRDQAAAAGFNESLEYKIGSKTYTKYYKIVKDVDTPSRWQAERGCLAHHGVLPAIHSLAEARQLAKAFYPGASAIPLGFDSDSNMNSLRWYDGFQCSMDCPNYERKTGRYGMFHGKLATKPTNVGIPKLKEIVAVDKDTFWINSRLETFSHYVCEFVGSANLALGRPVEFSAKYSGLYNILQSKSFNSVGRNISALVGCIKKLRHFMNSNLSRPIRFHS